MNRNKNRTRQLFAALLILCLLPAGIIGRTRLWLRTQRRQNALNRQLIAALEDNNMERALALVNEGADPNTCLDSAPAPSLQQFVHEMLHPTPPFTSSPTAFELSGQLPEYPPLVRAMIEHGANVNMRGHDGRTPLMSAVNSHRLETVRLLLDHGANVRNHDGQTALWQEVLAAGDKNTSAEWRGDGADPNADKQIIRHLIAHGADPNAVTAGVTPLRVAQAMNRPDLVALLKQSGAKDKGKRIP